MNQRKQKEKPWQIFDGTLKTRSHKQAGGFIKHYTPEYAPASAEKVLKPIAASGAEHVCEQAN